MAPTFLLLYAITNEKTLKLMQIDKMLLPLPKLSPQKHVPITLVGIHYLSHICLGGGHLISAPTYIARQLYAHTENGVVIIIVTKIF